MAERLICRSEDVVERGAGVSFEVERFGRMEPAFVIRFNGRVYAYLNRCAHAPTRLDWQDGGFFDFSRLYLRCATHGALYAPESGRCMGGRCDGKGLQRLDVVEHDGAIHLNEANHV